ncbi:hypothetical protein A3C57_01975 [Candidatus Nomurabacteria bacterium RIFCSPHIGHO2_02_FULL_33_12]|uniref:Thioredoxin domain-containing protein n=1 Tax=Candidatus Nomurabacteria bacterium RIFCSPLOWO2_01_FULL_33_17 TaxID=1801764 RepID=A0A1F6WN73_9BACT|nr:MAG: hypothetical protein A3C57_01975 [Candidatus Nomurabacteria bacterium RIFCSPHIGHO2_02_FULL_33_12]OGI83330.1 MAG: hypothetical protein A2903_02925 [Candidatus Nomurabacteria bacterium RIFCSPLOWO2_01_FULL_33_17]
MIHQDVKRYLVVFVITLALFVTTLGVSSFFSKRKLENIKTIQDQIGIDIMSSETQFQLLQELSCKDVAANTLSDTLNDLADKIAYSEQNIKNTDEVTELKRYYSLLEIKDYLLMQKIKAKCGTTVVPVFYFYTTAEKCSECIKQSAVLTELRRDYPEMRVYSFDYNLDLSALQSLIKIFKVEDTKLPALVMDEKLYTGFQSIEDIERAMPQIIKMREKRLKAEASAKALQELEAKTLEAKNLKN